MKTHELRTPNFLLDLDVLEENIAHMGELCRRNSVQLWPMIKTHKSIAIAKMQRAAGAQGFLVGTVDEAVGLVEAGFDNIMLAYPVMGAANIARVVQLAKKTRIIASLDGADAAAALNDALSQAGMTMEYLLIIDSGLHRLGVEPTDAVKMMQALSRYRQLIFKGIGTHPGHVYGATNSEQVQLIAAQETQSMAEAARLLDSAGYKAEIIAVGSTPTATAAAQSGLINVLRPGNYVFYDAIQTALDVVPAKRCALSVMATVIANPRPNSYIIDAGSKCLGLDKGAHGNALLTGYGIIKGYPNAVVESLSEEVGKIKTPPDTPLQVGQVVEIIPNHACAAAYMTDRFITHRQGMVQGEIRK